MRSRALPLILLVIPVAFVLVLLIWGLVRDGEGSGRPGVNIAFGEVPVSAPEGSDFQLPLLGGGEVSLSNLSGKIIVVDFWSSWCPPCNAEAPVLADAHRKWRDQGVEFIGVAIWDNSEEVQKFATRHGIEYPVALDEKGEAAIEFGLTGIPEKFFITPDGRITKKVVGPNTKESLERILGELTDEHFGISAKADKGS